MCEAIRATKSDNVGDTVAGDPATVPGRCTLHHPPPPHPSAHRAPLSQANRRDAAFLGDCDDGVKQLAEAAGVE